MFEVSLCYPVVLLWEGIYNIIYFVCCGFNNLGFTSVVFSCIGWAPNVVRIYVCCADL